MKLVEIMIYHNFDGYLINIESDVEDAAAMADWVRLLTVLAHSAKQNSLIIWYDSLVSTGKVRWQSVLNQENLQFMQACDGFFTDYHWKKECLPSPQPLQATTNGRYTPVLTCTAAVPTAVVSTVREWV